MNMNIDALGGLDSIVFTETDCITVFYRNGEFEVLYVEKDDGIFAPHREYISRETFDGIYRNMDFLSNVGWLVSHLEFEGRADDVTMREVFVVVDDVELWQDEGAA